jgi:hypothetical protein
MKRLSEYESEMPKAIHAWENPELGWFSQGMRLVNWRLDAHSFGAHMRLAFALVCATVALAGCGSTGVGPADRGTYMVAKKSAAGIFGTPDGVRADIYTEANEFCAKNGKAVETVNIEVKQAIPFVRTSSAMLQFKCVDP